MFVFAWASNILQKLKEPNDVLFLATEVEPIYLVHAWLHLFALCTSSQNVQQICKFRTIFVRIFEEIFSIFSDQVPSQLQVLILASYTFCKQNAVLKQCNYIACMVKQYIYQLPGRLSLSSFRVE